MILNKKRIRSLDSNLKGIQDGQDLIIAIPFSEDIKWKFISCGFDNDLSPGEKVLPKAIGPISKFNSEGDYDIHKDQPKETKYRQIEWTWKEFRGRYDTVERSRIVEVPYERFPRTFIEPPSIELELATKPEGSLLAISPTIKYSKKNEKLLLHIINLFLELFQECHIIDTSLQEIINAPIKRLNWEILPKGKKPWGELRPLISTVIDSLPDGNKRVIDKRLETINSHEPQFVAIGKAGFSGYLIFGFPAKNLFILESTQVNNATYVLGKDWEILSSLSKAEILNENLYKNRVIHRENWFSKMNQMFSK